MIGVHTPEFAFEHNPDNVRQAAKDMGIAYPVALDNDYAVWRAFANHYWPALYFVDAEGRIRHHHFGEGEYEQSEMVIQHLLAEAGSGDIGPELVSVDAQGIEAPADWATLRSPENYTSYERTENFASPGGVRPGQRHSYTAPARLGLNDWALSGDWTMEEQATLNTPSGRIVCRFHARDLNLVLGPAGPGTSVRFRVLIDGQPPGADRGTDVDDQGHGKVVQQRLYQLIRAARPHHRPHLRDRLPRPGSPGLRVHLRLIGHQAQLVRHDDIITLNIQLTTSAGEIGQPRAGGRMPAWARCGCIGFFELADHSWGQHG